MLLKQDYKIYETKVRETKVPSSNSKERWALGWLEHIYLINILRIKIATSFCIVCFRIRIVTVKNYLNSDGEYIGNGF